MLKNILVQRAGKDEAYIHRFKTMFDALGFNNMIGHVYDSHFYLPYQNYMTKTGVLDPGLGEINPDVILIQRQYTEDQVKKIEEYKNYGFPLGVDIEDNFWSSSIYGEELRNLEKVIKMSDFVIVPNPILHDVVHSNTGVAARILPTFLPAHAFEKPKERTNHKLKIGWLKTIYESDSMLPIIKDTAKLYDWHVLGDFSNELTHYAKHIPITSPLEYMPIVKNLDLDLAVVGTVENDFTICRSPLTVLQFSALGVPTICMDLTIFRETPASLIPNGWRYVKKWKTILKEFDTREKDRQYAAWKAYLWAQTYTAESKENSKLIELAWTP